MKFKESNEIKNRIVDYWTARSGGFAKLRRQELSGYMSELWLKEIAAYLPCEKRAASEYKILDVGTGSGFFAVLLAKLGYKVTGIDLTGAMIEEAKRAARAENLSESSADFLVMDAENLIFEDESFDMVITRNLTWTLPHPVKAYTEWKRVLKKDGVLLNFDADYGAQSFGREDVFLPENHAHRQVSSALRAECELIKESLPINEKARPAWDLKVLNDIGYSKITADTSLSGRIYYKRDQFYNPAPVFLIAAQK